MTTRLQKRKDNVTDAADDVGAVGVELDVLIFVNGGEAKLLDGDEVAVDNYACLANMLLIARCLPQVA